MSGPPNKIERELSAEQLAQFLEELKGISAKPTFAQIQEAAKRHGVTVSLMGARTFRNSTFAEHLRRIADGRERAQQILQAVRGEGAHPLDAVEEAAAADLLDAYTSGEDVDHAAIVKTAVQLRDSIEQRKTRERADSDLKRRLADSEARRQNMQERLNLAQLDVARAALEHVRELRAIASDDKINAAEKLERARVRLFGEAAADVPTLGDLDPRKGAGK